VVRGMRGVRAVLAVLAMVAGTVALVAPTAQASPVTEPATVAAPVTGPVTQGGSCTVLVICSQTQNTSTLVVSTARNWVCGGGTGATGGYGCVSGPFLTIGSGTGHTPYFEDWDSFRVDAGYCYRVTFVQPHYQWNSTYNRVGAGAVWVKVGDTTTAVVTAQRYGSCP
jgi:hypothetical protein